MNTTPERVLVVCGPTATGKTGLAVELARRFDGEIVNADSRQVYRYMDIGTAKPTPAQREAIPHHLLNVVDPDAPFTLADYLDLARPVVDAIGRRGRLPIVVGGTGLYVRALVQGYAVPRVAPDAALRRELEQLAEAGGTTALLERLRRVDPAAARRIDAANPRRLIRAIEVAEALTMPTPMQREAAPSYNALVVGLTGERAALYARADRRVDAMMAQGFLHEVAALYARGYAPDLPAMSGLGYRELGAHLRGSYTLAEAVEATKLATHRFIRRQLTWFRREPGLRWIDVTDVDPAARVAALVAPWLGVEREIEAML